MDFCKFGLAVIETEAQAIHELSQRIDEQFDRACRLLLACEGRVVVTGMGKSGHIARKISSTLSSIGTPALYMHPGEASHGDLGMITTRDAVIIISYSGYTPEIMSIIASLKRLAVPIIALTGNPTSAIAEASDAHINVSVKFEACPLGLAPTTSTTACLVMGDALAIALLQARGFTPEDFARSHPGGQLGKKLLLKVNDLWHTDDALPVVHESLTISDTLIQVTEKKLGMTCVVNHIGELSGVYTDGDVRRTLNKQVDIHSTPVSDVMSTHCKTIQTGMLAVDALSIMQEHSITTLVGIDAHNKPLAVLHLHDLLKAGVI
ncbi:MAG: KpsF/GutQ family sugar-phosphate isomerase [Gammaproteobacteria bacterium]|nr:KpsF/GutQ family sugar-phosphate isomerase [Gammaproteobacteria bacterium]